MNGIESLRAEGEVVEDEQGPLPGGKRRDDLENIRLADVEKHKTKKTGIWVVYKSGVYDITSFVDDHPGGDKILLAAGGSIEPFWALFAAHQRRDVHEMLERLRIANLHPEDEQTLRDAQRKDADANDPYRHDPFRPPGVFVVNSNKPFNAETPPTLLTDSFYTPNALHYVRNHLPVPPTDLASHRLRIEGLGLQGLTELSVDELKNRFEPHTVTVTLQCAGNRRRELGKVREVKGLSWDRAAIGTATYTGARLRDVLRHAGFDVDRNSAGARHVHFDGSDRDMTGTSYGASIPIHKAIDPQGDVILAYEMNGEPLPRDHGFPLRVVVPGTVGARSVKWLRRIATSTEESPSFWQRRDYKSFPPSVTDFHNLDWENAVSIQEMPIQGCICEPLDGATFRDDDEVVTLRGYAFSGGGRSISRVDVTPDGGKTWFDASLDDRPDEAEAEVARRGLDWSWRLWEAEIPTSALPQGEDEVEVSVRAVDNAYNVQPEHAEWIWNPRGLLNNAWSRVRLRRENAEGGDEGEQGEEE